MVSIRSIEFEIISEIQSNTVISNLVQVSIIESTWPENLLPIQSRVFPNYLSHAKSHCDCNGIVQTTQTAIDRNNGLLWLIDNGSKLCAPKLIIFDLLRGNNEVNLNWKDFLIFV